MLSRSEKLGRGAAAMLVGTLAGERPVSGSQLLGDRTAATIPDRSAHRSTCHRRHYGRGGALRPKNQISVGTREQLSTLYRLSLAEYLSTAIVMDGSRCIISRTPTQSPTLIVNAAPGKRLCPSFSPTHPIGPSGHPRRPEARGRLPASQSQTFPGNF